MLPLPKVLGLEVSDETVEDERIIEGLEMDIVSHDVKKFFGLLLKKNGYTDHQKECLKPAVQTAGMVIGRRRWPDLAQN